MMRQELVFQEVTLGLPVQAFSIKAHISMDERLPAVTEFVLRLLDTCESISQIAFRDYFGFTNGESVSVIESLERQGFIEMEGDRLRLSQQARDRFEYSDDGLPWITKVKKRSDRPNFDLLTFSYMSRVAGASSGFTPDSWLKLDPPSANVGNSIAKAKDAYTAQFPQIARDTARRQGNERERNFGVYSVEDVQAQRFDHLPVTMRFSLDMLGRVAQQLARAFEKKAPPGLIGAVRRGTQEEMDAIRLPKSDIQEFITAFELTPFVKYLQNGQFDLTAFAIDVSEKRLPASAQWLPLFGSLSLAEQREWLISGVRDACAADDGRNTSRSIAWLAPSYSLWERTESFKLLLRELREIVDDGKEGSDIFLFDFAAAKDELQVSRRYRGIGIRELHLARPDQIPTRGWKESLELLVLPDKFVAALYYLPVESVRGLMAPVGFISYMPAHIAAAQDLIVSVASGRHYAGKWDPNARRDPATQGGPHKTFSEACGFVIQKPLADSHK